MYVVFVRTNQIHRLRIFKEVAHWAVCKPVPGSRGKGFPERERERERERGSQSVLAAAYIGACRQLPPAKAEVKDGVTAATCGSER